MTDKGLTVAELIAGLKSRGLVEDGFESTAEEYLTRVDEKRGDPFYIRALAAAGAWGGAVCFVTFLAMADLLEVDEPSGLVWGLIFLGAAVGVRRFFRSTFPVQLTLAFCSAGHGLLLAWAADYMHYDFPEMLLGMALAQGVATLVLYWPYPEAVYRFMAPAVFFILISLWATLERGRMFYMLDLLIAFQTVLAGAVLAGRMGGERLRPLGYAAAMGVPLALLVYTVPDSMLGFLHDYFFPSKWRISFFLALALIALYAWAAGFRRKALISEWMIAAAATTAALAAVTNPGILAAIGLLMLGRAIGDRVVAGFGLVFLPCFIVLYYYNLHVTLLEKSYILLASGAVLLAARWIAGRRPWAGEAGE